MCVPFFFFFFFFGGVFFFCFFLCIGLGTAAAPTKATAGVDASTVPNLKFQRHTFKIQNIVSKYESILSKYRSGQVRPARQWRARFRAQAQKTQYVHNCYLHAAEIDK